MVLPFKAPKWVTCTIHRMGNLPVCLLSQTSGMIADTFGHFSIINIVVFGLVFKVNSIYFSIVQHAVLSMGMIYNAIYSTLAIGFEGLHSIWHRRAPDDTVTPFGACQRTTGFSRKADTCCVCPINTCDGQISIYLCWLVKFVLQCGVIPQRPQYFLKFLNPGVKQC